jgi:hypothetical protein
VGAATAKRKAALQLFVELTRKILHGRISIPQAFGLNATNLDGLAECHLCQKITDNVVAVVHPIVDLIVVLVLALLYAALLVLHQRSFLHATHVVMSQHCKRCKAIKHLCS